MTLDWTTVLPDWVTPACALGNWRERIERVAAKESAHYAALPFVTGVAITGSVGRQDPWPLSDIDMVIVADDWQGHDPEDLIRAEDARRNQRLHAQHIVNEVEACEWVLGSNDVAAAAGADEDAFFRMVQHPHWLGIVIKSQDARTIEDTGGWLARFLARCNGVVSTDRFVRLWLVKVIASCGRRLSNAGLHMGHGDWARASLEILKASYHQLASGLYAVWRKIPQSAARSASRFLAAAEAAGDEAAGASYLTMARLDEPTVRQRIAALPEEGQHRHRVIWAVRLGAGEDVDELSAARDFLNLAVHCAMGGDNDPGPWPAWVGAAEDEASARAQHAAACAMVDRLKATVAALRT